MTDDVLRTLGSGGDVVNIQRRGIGGENRAGFTILVELGKDLFFNVHIFKRGFND